MSTITSPQDPETNPRIKAIFDDIRATRKSDFINNISHEFKTPIATINLALDAMSSSKDKYLQLKSLIEAKKNNFSGGGIFSDLLNISKFREKQIHNKIQLCNSIV